MASKLRIEAEELIRDCNRLIGLARIDKDLLTNEEREILLFHAQELEKEISIDRKKHDKPSPHIR